MKKLDDEKQDIKRALKAIGRLNGVSLGEYPARVGVRLKRESKRMRQKVLAAIHAISPNTEVEFVVTGRVRALSKKENEQ